MHGVEGLIVRVETDASPGTPALVEPEYAKHTAAAFQNARYVQVPGNHMTMVFGDAAVAVNREIETFVAA